MLHRRNWDQTHRVLVHFACSSLSRLQRPLPETTSSPCARGTRRRPVGTRRRLRRRQSANGGHGDGKDLVCRVSKVGHTANLFAVCIYRRTAKKSEQTPSRPAAIRRVPAPWTHGEHPAFAVCPWFWHTAKYGQFAVCAA